MNRTTSLLAAALCLIWAAATVVAQDDSRQLKLESAELGSTRDVHAFGKNLLCGQPSREEFAEAKSRGIEVVISLREEGEIEWDERAAIKNLGLKFHHFGFRTPDSLTPEILDQSLKILAGSKKAPVLLHCASANRVGAVWLAHRVLNDGISIEEASREAKTVGLRNADYEETVLKYIKTRSAD